MPKKQKQEIKAGVIVDLTPAQDLVIASLLYNAQTLEIGIRTLVQSHRHANEELFKCVFEIFPELENFHIAADVVKGKVIIHVRSRR